MPFRYSDDEYGPTFHVMAFQVIKTLKSYEDTFGSQPNRWESLCHELESKIPKYNEYYEQLIKIECHNVVKNLPLSYLLNSCLDIPPKKHLVIYFDKKFFDFDNVIYVDDETMKDCLDIIDARRIIEERLYEILIARAKDKNIKNSSNRGNNIIETNSIIDHTTRSRFKEYFEDAAKNYQIFLIVSIKEYLCDKKPSKHFSVWDVLKKRLQEGISPNIIMQWLEMEVGIVLNKIDFEDALLYWCYTENISFMQETRLSTTLVYDFLVENVSNTLWLSLVMDDMPTIESSPLVWMPSRNYLDLTNHIKHKLENINATVFGQATVWEHYQNYVAKNKSDTYSPLLLHLIEIESDSFINNLEIKDLLELWVQIQDIKLLNQNIIALDELVKDISTYVKPFLYHLALEDYFQRVRKQEIEEDGFAHTAPYTWYSYSNGVGCSFNQKQANLLYDYCVEYIVNRLKDNTEHTVGKFGNFWKEYCDQLQLGEYIGIFNHYEAKIWSKCKESITGFILPELLSMWVASEDNGGDDMNILWEDGVLFQSDLKECILRELHNRIRGRAIDEELDEDEWEGDEGNEIVDN